MIYKAEFEDEEMEIFEVDNHKTAVQEAYSFENEHGCLFNIILLDDNYNEIRTIF